MTKFLDTPVDKSLGATGAWTDIDLSSDVPAGATGAIFRIKNNAGWSRDFGIRNNGSTDDRYESIGKNAQEFAIIGLDAARICEGKIATVDVDFFLVGYTEKDVTFLTNGTDKSLGATGAWTNIDLSGDIAAGSVAAIFEVINVGGSHSDVGLRKNGSTDDRHTDVFAGHHIFMVVGVDANRICEGYVQTVDVDFYLLGYLTLGQAETNAHDRSLGTTGSYVDIDESANAPVGATGVFGELSGSIFSAYAVRKKGTSFDYYAVPPAHAPILVGVDGDRKWQGKIANVSTDFFTMGYFVEGLEKTSSDVGVGADAQADLIASRVEAETGVGVDVLVSILKAIAKYSSDVGVGADALSNLLSEIIQSDQGAGVEALGSRVFGSEDEGIGLDEILELALSGSDTGIGSDKLKALLATIHGSDTGTGVEAQAIDICICLLLKLLQKKRLNIELSQDQKG